VSRPSGEGSDGTPEDAPTDDEAIVGDGRSDGAVDGAIDGAIDGATDGAVDGATDDEHPVDQQSGQSGVPGATGSRDGRFAGPSSPAAMAARIEALEAETRRLRAESRRAKRTRYRRTAAGLAGVGVVAALAGLLFPDASDVLFALAGTGLFAAVLTRYLTPERFVAADVGERVYAPLAANHGGLAAALGLADDRVYVPRDGDPRLFVPQYDRHELPADDALAETLVVPEAERARGLSLRPTGGALFDEFERTLSGPLATTPRSLCDQLTAALVESFELADATEVDVDPTGGRASIAVSGSAYGPGDRFDDPLVSLLAVGLAVGLDRPVRATVDRIGGRDDEAVGTRSQGVDADGFVATFRWEPTGDGDDDDLGDGDDGPSDPDGPDGDTPRTNGASNADDGDA
jgi:hypothetical protein